MLKDTDTQDADGVPAAEWLHRQRRLNEDVAADVVAKAVALSPLVMSSNQQKVSENTVFLISSTTTFGVDCVFLFTPRP